LLQTLENISRAILIYFNNKTVRYTYHTVIQECQTSELPQNMPSNVWVVINIHV